MNDHDHCCLHYFKEPAVLFFSFAVECVKYMRSEENKTVKLPSFHASETCKLQLGAGINTRKAYRRHIVMRPYSFWKATQIPWTHRNIQQYDDWCFFLSDIIIGQGHFAAPLVRNQLLIDTIQPCAAFFRGWSLLCRRETLNRMSSSFLTASFDTKTERHTEALQ